MRYSCPLALALAVPAAGQFGPEVLVSSTTPAPFESVAADVDGDGRVDLVTISRDELVWRANTGAVTYGPEQVITTAVDGGQ